MMITPESKPIDIAYYAVYEQLFRVVCYAEQTGDRKLKWRAARSLLAIEKMMGTRKRFTESVREISFGDSRAGSVRPIGDKDLIKDALVEVTKMTIAWGSLCESESEAPSEVHIRWAVRMVAQTIKSVFGEDSEVAEDMGSMTLNAVSDLPASVFCSPEVFDSVIRAAA